MQINLGSFQNSLSGLLVMIICGGLFVYSLIILDKPKAVTDEHNGPKKPVKKIFLKNQKNKRRHV